MDKWDSISKENTPMQRYVAKKSTILKRVSGECDTNIIVLKKGMLAELVNGKSDLDHDVIIRVTDTKESKVWRNTEWCCPKTDLLPISSGMWTLLLAVSPEDRFSIASDKSLCQELQSIQVNDYVWYHEHANPDIKYKAIVKFIGPVPERGQGSYFGLDVEYQESNEKFVSSAKQYPVQTSVGKMATASDITPLHVKMPGHDRHLSKFEIHKNEMDQEKMAALDSSQAVLEALCTFDDGTNNNYNAELLLDEKYKDLKLHSSKNNGANWMKYNKNFSTDNIAEKNENKKYEKIEKAGDFKVGSNVKVSWNSKVKSGVIQWIGTHVENAPGKLMAVVELDDEYQLGANEHYDDMKCFQRQPHTIFTDIELCSHLDTFPMDNFSNMESSVITGIVRPIIVKDDLKSICGKYRGIQGHHNSCYLDATLFSMFAFTSVFDSLLFRPPNKMDCSQYEEVQRVLREEIVNPLRKDMFVAANRVMKLRTLLEKLSSVSGLTSEEKDPEEFLTSLVAQILNAEPFLKLSSGQDAYHYQLFVEKDDHLNLPTVQQLLEQSFFTSNVRLKEVPSCFIIQMPRFGKSFKMYSKIQPTLLLDVTDIIENSPRQCTVCGKVAEFECKECYGQCDVGLESISFCSLCLEKVHLHERRTNHKPKKLTVPMEFAILKDHCPVPRLFLELSAVVCIETSHYVSFVKCGPGSEAPWCFFDSMADREGEKNGYNIPEMVPCPDFPYWLSEEGRHYLSESTDDRKLPEHAKRLLCDAYMCMYQSPDVMMYK